MHTILPEGWDITQFDAKHPGSNYEMIVRVILNEIARPLSMPFNIASCNSAGYNYSSGRLDHQTYYKSIEVDQSLLESSILDPMLRSWWDEASFVPGLLDGLPSFEELDWQWCWDAQPVIDENTDANASTSRLQSGQSTLPLEWQRRGYGDVATQLAKGAESLGVSVEDYQRLIQFKLFGTTVDQLAATAPAMTGTLPDDSADPNSINATGDQSPSLGVSQGVRRRDVINNQKSIRDTLTAYINGESETITRINLKRLGVSDADIDLAINDANDGQLDDPAPQPVEEVPA